MSSEKTNNFQQEYQTLKTIADEMQSTDIDDVDALIKKVEQGTRSYKICKARLDAAKLKLNALLAETAENDNVDKTASDTTLATDDNEDAIPF